MDQLLHKNIRLVNIVYLAAVVFYLILISAFTDTSVTSQASPLSSVASSKNIQYSTSSFEQVDNISGGQTLAQSITLAKSRVVAGVQDTHPSATTLGGAVQLAMREPQNEANATSIKGSIEMAKRESKRSFPASTDAQIVALATPKVKGETADVYYEKPDLSSIKGSIEYAMMLD